MLCLPHRHVFLVHNIPKGLSEAEMSDTNMIETMQSAAEQLSPVLWNAHWEALQDAERRMRGLAHEKYPMLRPLVARACLREVLTAGG